MGFLRRLLGGSGSSDVPGETAEPAQANVAELDAAELAHELEVIRAEQERHDDLTQRQLRYANYAWQPPAQGGERRADDEDARDAT
jgi:hypothetical protein